MKLNTQKKKLLMTQTKKINIILDCDPGHDDAVAIMLLANNPLFNLLGISVASGNQTIEKTALNTSNLCHYLKINCPIAKGSSTPLVATPMICPEVHGESGLDGFTFPKYEHQFDSRTGAQLIIDLALANEKVTIITTGPMTNLALALRVKPEIKDHIEEIIFMGGSIDYGNVSPASEFNILVDPESAHICLTSGLKIKMIGLNVTRLVRVDHKNIQTMAKLNTKSSELYVALMKVFLENQIKTFGVNSAPLHDPVTVASLIDDSLVTFKEMNVTIDLSHGPSYGRTNADVFDYLKAPHNCLVATNIDKTKFFNLIEETLKIY